ncbi:MAG: MMPL family transporter [Actinomycetota bacterium]|nr:MMPL family transporter [Actinomycetota bacterium]
MKINPAALAVSSSKHPLRTVITWIVVVMAMGTLTSKLLEGVLSNDIAFTNAPESVRARDVIDQKFLGIPKGSELPDTEFVIVQSSSTTVDDPAYQAYVASLQEALSGSTAFVKPPVTTYFDASSEQAKGLVSSDRKTTLIPIVLTNIEKKTVDGIRSVLAQHQASGFTVQVAGQATLNVDFAKVAQDDAKKGEGIGLLFALIVLIVVFASLIAALLPIAMSLVAIPVALGLVALIGQLFQFNLFVENMVTMIGLAVGIDYSLFIVSRYREERKKGFDKMGAIAASGATANRAVFFSGMTVVLALLGMLIIPTTIFRALAGGAILVTIAALAASMTLLPALLALLGDRINWPRLGKRAHVDTPHDVPGGFWDRLTRSVMARPVVYLLASILVLGGLGSFYFQLNRGSSTGVSQLPDSVPSKQAFLILEREFSGGVTQPAQIVITGSGVSGSGVQPAIQKLNQEIAADPAFSPNTTTTTNKDGTAIEVDALFKGDPSSDTAFQGIRDLRSKLVPKAFEGVPNVEVLVGGNAAFFTDFLHVANSYQWIVLAFVLSLSFILLTVVFRSIVLPLKAILMNLLSVGAAYGAITLVFQKGIGIGFFNAIGFSFHKSEAIEAWLPLFLFSVLFGLSMDYHVFLLSRIREEYEKTHNNTEAVAYGLRTTAGIITGAALIMVVVFIAFASGSLGPLQQMGFGLAVAVFMDATIVRTLLVPAGMRLLGDLNWYLPKWLQWLPKLNIEGHEPDLVAAGTSGTAGELVEARET